MKRRFFLTTTAGALAASRLPAIGPFDRKGDSRMMLGLAAYSFRDSMKWTRGKPNPAKGGRPSWELTDFIDFCADHDCPGAELTSYYFPPDVDDDYLLEIKRHAYLRGVVICGTAVGNTFTHPEGRERRQQIAYVNQWINHAAVMGAPHVRVFAGNIQNGGTRVEAEKNFLESYRECLQLAAEKGVFLGLENHGGIVAEADDLIRLIRAADSPWAGINFDSGNFKTADPYGDLAKIAPYAVNVQVKMTIHPKGSAKPEPTDVPRVLQILRDANYQGWFILEYEEGADPDAAIPPILRELKSLLAGQ